MARTPPVDAVGDRRRDRPSRCLNSVVRSVRTSADLVYGHVSMTTSTRIICPYCGSNERLQRVCASCGGLLDLASRAATAKDIGPWFLRDPDRPFFPGFTHSRLHRMVRDGQLRADSIVRGPTTDGFWLPADRVPGLAQMLGRCHGCQGLVGSDDQACPRCGVPLGFEHQLPLSPLQAEDQDAASALELIKHAQYRQISRLQNQVRLQAIALAIAAGVLFLGVVVFLTGILTPASPASDDGEDPVAVESAPVEVEVDAPQPIEEAVSTEPAFEDSTPPSPPPVEAAAESPAVEVAEAPKSESDGVAAIEEKLLEQLRDVTPEQGALINRIGELLGVAKSRSRSELERSDAIREAFRIIDDQLVNEQEDLM